MKRLSYCIAFVAVCLPVITSTAFQCFAQASEETSLRTLREQYFEAYAKKDIIKLRGSWTLRSPDAIPTLEKIQQSFESEAYAFSNLRLSNIKIAAPAVLSDAGPVYSSILLSQTATDTQQDGLLQAGEILKLNVKSDIVMLTACEAPSLHQGDG